MSYSILVTGANGFIGKNLIENLKNIRDGKDKVHKLPNDLEILEYDIKNSEVELEEYCKKANFIFNLAGVNRPKNNSEFMKGNFNFGEKLLNLLKKNKNNCPIMLSSSIQASLEGRYEGSEYGRSKLAGEKLFKNYAKETGAKVLIYRFPNLFGKWCRPNYNSVIATFCNNIANDLPIQVNDRNTELDLVYIDDLLEELLRAVNGNETRDEKGYCYIPEIHHITLGEIADLLYSFKESRKTLFIPNMLEGSFSKKLYSTYLSYLNPKDFSYSLKMNEDNRGSFTEIIKSLDRGQVSVNISKPGITKGQHWHNTKNEKFLVVAGEGIIQLRKIGTDEVIEYKVSGKEMTVVDMIPGYTHNIINTSNIENLVTVMWCNECFNPERPDTYFEEV
ncbi:NAD-dependent epimerase/dehydratase family protein [Fusobacterium sp. SYSU M8D902]|uniref:polysaccharide biosynthesis C-terminal domain-containing protein n=1 Tax=Fusobacterium sp. SYSU M8D902 TaxID=3159562 RepID=UPI0032E4B631